MFHDLVRRGAVVLAVGMLAAGCAGAPSDAPGSAAPTVASVPTSAAPAVAGGLSVTLKQYRADAARDVLQVTLGNTGPGTVAVRSLALGAPELVPVPPTPRADTLVTGNRYDLAVGYGGIRCGAAPPGPTEVVAEVTRDGVPAEVVVPVTRPDPTLDVLVARDCARQAVAAAVELDLRVGPPAGTSLPARVSATRSAGSTADVVVTGVAGSVLHDLAPARTAPVLTLGATEQAAATDTVVTVARCDAHARADSKRSFVLPAWVVVDGAPEVYTTLTVDDATQAAMAAFLEQACVGRSTTG